MSYVVQHEKQQCVEKKQGVHGIGLGTAVSLAGDMYRVAPRCWARMHCSNGYRRTRMDLHERLD